MSDERSHSGGGPEVDLEQLAAFVDGKLDGKEREEVVRLLAGSEEAREVVAEAMRLRDEAEAAPSLEVVSDDASPGDREPAEAEPTSGRGTPWKVLVPLAAAAALAGILLIPGLRKGGDSFTLDLARQVAQPAGELAPPWARSRGFRQTVTAEKQAFRAGYHLGAVALAWTGGDLEEARRQLAVTRRVVEDTGVAGPALSALDQLESEMADPANRGIEAAFQAAEEQVQALHEQPWARLGAWAAAADQALAGGDMAFFGNPDVTHALGELAVQEWPDRVSTAVVPLSDALVAGQLPDPDGLRPMILRLLAAGGV